MNKLKSKLKTKNLKPKTRFMITNFRLKNRKLLIGGVSIAIILLAVGLLVYQQAHKKVQKAEPTTLQAYVSKIALPVKDKNVKKVVQKENGYTLTTAEKGNIDSPVSFAAKGGEISFTSIQNQNLGGLNSSDMEKTKDGKTIYNNIYNGINLIYTPSSNGILEEYEVKVKRPLTNIIQKIDVTGLTYKTQTDGSILFYNKDNQFAFAIPKPVMYEEYNTKNRSYGLHYEIFTYKGNTYLAKIIDTQGQEWLSKTNYPVMIDATILLTLFSYQSYPTIASNWQVSIDTVGTGDLKIQPAQGTTSSGVSIQSITCGGTNVQYSNSNGVATISNYSCGRNTVVTSKVADASKQYSLSFSWSGFNTVVSSTAYNGKPVIISSSLSPAVVKIGDTITVKTEVADQNGVKSVKADMGGIQIVDLALSSGTAQDGVWQGQWKVEGTGTKPYETIITASNDTQTTSSSIGFFDPYTCLGGGDHAGADWDPATDCPSGFAGNHTNIGTMSVGAGETATVQAFDGVSNYGIATISATTVTVAATGTITVAGKGWAGGAAHTAGSGPGGGGANSGGGGYGGTGGIYGSGTSGIKYGSLTTPLDLGSGGGGENCSNTGGSGGGAIRIIATGTLTVSGAINANGNNNTGCGGGGGSGGSIYLTAATLSGSGTISSNGGSGHNNVAGGGGGRIAMYYTSANNFAGTTTATAGGGGTNGTVFTENTTTQDVYITISQTWDFNPLLEGRVNFTYNSITVQNNSTLTLNGYYTNNTNGVGFIFNVVNFTVASGSTINSSGYAGGAAHTAGSGPGGGGANSGGGGYGGTGGIYGTGTSGTTYGSSIAPLDLGSGGGGEGCSNTLAVGGGAIRIIATGTLTVSGVLSANGTNYSGCGGGGGSGGSIYLTAATLSGSGTISSNGGGGYNNVAGGGGGRIAMYYTSANNFAGTTTATAGGGGTNGTVNIALDNIPTISTSTQYQTDCTNSIAVGGTLQGNNQGSTGCFKATLNSANSSDNLIFQIEAQPIGTNFTNFYSASSSATAFSGTPITISVSQPGFALGSAYHWQYRVVDQVGVASSWTSFGGNSESAADFVANVPAPANITGTYNSDSQITVAWTNTALNVVNFEIQRSTNGGAYTTIGTTADGNTLTFVDNATNNPGSPPSANNKYQYQVKSNFNGYSSAYGTPSSLVYTTPAAPSGVSVSQTAVGSITINWTNNANYPSNFTVQRKIGSGSYATISSTVSSTAISYIDTNVQQNLTYSYQVSATRTTPDVLTSSYVQSSNSVSNTLGFGKGIYLTQNGSLIVQNNFSNSVDVFNNIQKGVADKVGQDVTYSSATPSAGPNLPTGSTLNGLTVKEGVSSVDGKSNVIYVATSNGLVAIHENSTTPALGGVKYYTNNYVTEMMYGDIRGMWPLDASASSGLLDASNKVQTLTNNGSITFTVSGIRGTAATLNGTTQYLSIADNANLSVTGNLSFGAWFKTTSTSSAQTIMAKNGSYSLGLTSSGTLTVSIIGATTGTATGSTVLDTGWHEAIVVYSSSAQSITLYLDGKVEASTTTSVPSSITDSAGAFNIGANAGATLFSGNIDEPFVTATAITAGETVAMNLNGLRSLQNHPGNIIAGVATNNYQRLLGNGSGDSTVNNVQAVAVDDGNQFIYAGTNDSGANTGGTTAIGVHSDSVADLYSATNTSQKDDQGNLFSANDAVAISVTGIPNPGFNTNSDYSQNGGTVAIAGTNDTASRLYIRNQSYSLTQVLAQGGASGGSKNSFNVGNLFTVGNLLGNSASTSGEVLQIPAFQVDQNGIVTQNYLGTDTTQTAATFNGGALTSGTILSISGPNLTSGTGFNLTSASTNLTGSLANFSLSATGSGATGNVLSLTNYSSGGGNTLNIQSIGTGTTNVALYASASGATNNYAALFPSGYVGIGTTVPTAALDIVGNASTSGQLTFRGSSSSINGLNGYGLTFKVSPGGDAGLTTAMFVNSAGNLGLGTISPTATLDVNGSASIAGQLTFENGYGTIQATRNQLLTFGGNTTGDIQFKPGNSNSLNLFSNGAIGIGTSSATNKLDIAGGIAIGSYAGNTAPSNGLIVSGNVGVGTNNPGARLEVKGTSQSVLMGDWGGGTNYAAISLNGALTTGNYNFISGTGDTNLYINRPSAKDIRFRENNSDQVTIQGTTGNLGIGTTGPATALEVSRNTSDLLKLTSTTGGAGNKAYVDFQTYNGSGINARIGAVDYGTYNGGLVFEVNPGNGANSTVTTEAMRITQTGQVGIGTPNPIGILNVSGASSGQALVNLNYTGTDQNIFTASSSGTTKLALSNTGSLTSAAGAQWKPFTDSTTALQIANSAGSSIMNFDTTNSRVGIGVTSPQFKLDLADIRTATSAAMFTNLSTSQTADVLALKVATISAQLSNYFLSFLDGNGNILGKVQANASGGVSYATNGIDFAEYFRRENSTELLNQGDVVCLGPTGGVTKCVNGNSNILGVVSGKAGFVGGGEHDQDPNYIAVGLIGQLPVNVSTQSGQINPGDSLTADNNGTVIKAKSQGQIVGQALEGYSGAGEGKVSIRINVSWYNPNALAGSEVSSSSGSLSALASRIDMLSGNISTLQNFFAFNSTASAFLNSSTSATGAGTLLSPDQLDIANATISGKLMVLGRTTLNDLGVTGKINSGLLTINGFDDSINGGTTTINTLAGDLYLQNQGLGGVNILNGLVTIDTNGNMNVAGVLGAQTVKTSKLIMQGNVGSATLSAGSTQVEIDNPDVASTSKVFVTLRTLVNAPLVVDYIGTGKFIVKIPSAQASDIKFDWWVIPTQ